MFPELVKNKTEMLGMVFFGLGENKNVIQIYENKLIGVRLNMKFIIREKVGGALARPKDMTVYS